MGAGLQGFGNAPGVPAAKTWQIATDVPEEIMRPMPNGRTVRRPVNHLIPLELGDDEIIQEKRKTDERHDESPETEPRYNLRPRRNTAKTETHGDATRATSIRSSIFTLTTALILLPMLTATSPILTNGNNSSIGIECIQGGAKLNAHKVRRYELCAENLCVTKMKPPPEETIIFPPEITLHEHRVQWKLYDGNHFTHLEVTCPPTSFCDNVNCWFCTANILNPECSPRAAIMAIATILYILTALLYALCYVPMVIGKPFRLIYAALVTFAAYIGRLLWIAFRKLRRRQRRRRNDIEAFLRAPLLSIAVAFVISLSMACQHVDVFTHEATTCLISSNGRKICSMETKEVLKLNSLQQEACIRFLFNRTLVKEVRIIWKGLQLTCEKKSTAFTRSTKQHVIDSKRCPGVGSCTGNKCEDINAFSKIEELAPGNNYPGITSCVESCGGPGCGCFYWSSGCLFYRIYRVSQNYLRQSFVIFKVEIISQIHITCY
uniref:Phlebovirus_G2 domain-containing protein n=1 Tax=Haemonchus contortus TaxID=6289 RepID=A0A7I4Y1J7_HAECO